MPQHAAVGKLERRTPPSPGNGFHWRTMSVFFSKSRILHVGFGVCVQAGAELVCVCFGHLRNHVTGKEEIVKVPLSLFWVPGNYASALFLAASKANVLDKVLNQRYCRLVEASKQNPVFLQFINDLSVPADVMVQAIQEIFSEAGFSEVTKNLLEQNHEANFSAVMAENGRLRQIENVAKSFVDLTMAHKGEVKVTVATVIKRSKN